MDYQTLNTNEAWNTFFLSELKKKGFNDNENFWQTDSGTYRFVHFSPKLTEILDTGSINISGGGLMATVYVTSIHSDGIIHNL